MNAPVRNASIRLSADVGGTFTDVAAFDEKTGELRLGKTLTTPDDPGIAVTTVMVDLLKQIAESRGNAKREVADVVHGTTLVTNTLIERKGAVTGLIMTRGFRDIVEMGTETRYDIYDLGIDLPPPLVEAFRSTLEETLDADQLLLVVDLADPGWNEQLRTVHTILDGLDSTAPRRLIGNQIDRCPAAALEQARAEDPQVIFVSATAGLGLEHLRDCLFAV